ncbi:OLC1v1011805C1 [Oldenlandia corymbosa var. corymbosa]|uniref:adenylate kinase n=1 Tax=Oldenlandia corymbosa var. corymbosa TaxID=529605 RepID=A0AAV1DXP9_OLDCO|nr:OLC1v1011805C1 [Oldenlandia corymbosa var. corymbosa]
MPVLSRLASAAAQPIRRAFVRPGAGRRAYGSAAAVQLDYDDYDYDDDYVCRCSDLESKSEGWVSERGVQWVIMGDPMAKRHVYAERLSKLLSVPHISMGSLVRQELHPHSSIYKQIADSLNQGKLVPEDVIFGLLSKRLEEGQLRGESGFILDGIPRTRAQAEILDQIADIDLVVNLKSTDDCFVNNDLCNGIYSPSREFFRMGRSRFNLSLRLQDGSLKSSCFDVENVWKEKLRIYAEQSKPVEEYYRKQKKLLDCPVSGASAETWQGLLAALHLQHVNNAISSSQKLTA